ncbi:hypothetical protein [Demequina capsici]|uniref:Uncharacterized protein n=1 Tax=Demequina capsici TaxID=3075620 RepID=A0AA96F9M9_9MICO|nr:hypothetical protein [Demequina sp. OYTSA14]WNM25285.1 hypothetical protein RN606_03820 [Demequina sp. OYTSA14]
MDLFSIQHALIAGRTGEAWYVIPSHGPVFRERWSYGTGPEGGFVEILDEHHSQAVLREDPTLTMAWGLGVHDDRRKLSFDWAAENFADEDARLFWADFFWAGALIDRVVLASVDGARGVIPVPDRQRRVSSYELAVAEVIHDLDSHDENYRPADLVRRLEFTEKEDEHRGGAGTY